MKGYGEYKCTDEFWLPQIPAHWQFQKVKRLFSERIEKGHPDKPLLAATQNKGVVLKKDYGSRTVEATKDLHLLKLVRQGDFVISLRSFQGGIEYSHADGIISPAYTVMISSSKMVPGYFRYFAKIPCFLDLLKVCVTGIREGQNVDYKKLREHSIPIPPREEQDQIVRYLDAKVGKINQLIRIKQQQIALLKEKKQAIINQAVTRGLDPNAPMKDSGIAWIGQIPERWEVVKLKRIITRPLQYGANEAAQFTNDDWPRYIRITDITADGALKEETFRSLPYSIAQKYILKNGDILFARSGATVGKTFIYKDSWGECCFAGYLIKVSINTEKTSSEYIKVFTDSAVYKEWVGSVNIQATIQNISAEKYNDMPIPMPPLHQQHKILLFLQTALLPMVQAEIFLNQTLSALTEYRTRLISDVVTGKVDVRHIPIADADILSETEADLTLEDESGDSSDDLMTEA